MQVWEALQALQSTVPNRNYVLVNVYEQERVGVVRPQMLAILEIPEAWEAGYAWASPDDGKRDRASTWDRAVSMIQTNWPTHSPIDEVAVYRQRLGFIIHRDDPHPGLPAKIEPAPETPGSLIQQVLDGTLADQTRASLLSQLWIAESLQEIVMYQVRRRRNRSLFTRFKPRRFRGIHLPGMRYRNARKDRSRRLKRI